MEIARRVRALKAADFVQLFVRRSVVQTAVRDVVGSAVIAVLAVEMLGIKNCPTMMNTVTRDTKHRGSLRCLVNARCWKHFCYLTVIQYYITVSHKRMPRLRLL